MTLNTYTLSVEVGAPFLSHGNAAASFGLDASVARNAAGAPILPGTLVAGRLRHAWRAWGDLGKPFLKLLGKGSGDELEVPTGKFEPFRKQLLLDDLALDGAEEADVLTRIRLDGDTGAVAKGAMLVAEQIAAPGKTLKFSGTLRLAGLPETDAKQAARAVTAALEWTGQIGAERAVGYGQIKSVNCEAKPSAAAAPLSLPAAEEFGLSLTFDAPFCVPEKSLGKNNLFEGREVIPGAALKGSLATSWAVLLGNPTGTGVDEAFDASRKSLGRNFDRLIFRHAFPLKDGKRPLSLPQSLVKGGDTFHDIAGSDGPRLFQKMDKGQMVQEAPAFAIDWKGKDYALVMPALGWTHLKKETRVRTAIDGNTGRAKDEKLFAYEAIVPGDSRWGLNISLAVVPDGEREAVRNELQSLLNALGGQIGWIGKTKAFANIGVAPAFACVRQSAASPALKEGGTLRLVLQTDALIGDWPSLNETAGMEEMSALYRTAFFEASGGSLELLRHFARQKLLGGKYLHGRYGAGGTYRPWLLTEAGAVFVLTVKDAGKAAGVLEAWQARGLPLPAWLEKEIADSGRPRWQTIPYLPEGGYGEILLDPDTTISVGETK